MVIFLLLLVGLSIYITGPILMAVFFGALLAYIFYPLYNKVLKKIKNKNVSALLICLLIVIIFVVPSFFLLNTLVQESYVIYLLVKQKLAVGLFQGCEHSVCDAITNFGQNVDVQYQIQEVIKSITNWVIQKGSALLFGLPKILLNLFIMFFTLFYFLQEGSLISEKIGKFFLAQKNNYNDFLKRLKEIINGVVYGYLLIALIQGAFGALGFFLFGISSPLFWGVIMAFLALVPILGTGIIWIPASLILFLDGLFKGSNWLMFKGIALFAYSLVFVASLDNFIKPKLISGKAKIHPIIIVVGIFGGLFVFGPLGVIVGPLVLSVTTGVVSVYLLRKN